MCSYSYVSIGEAINIGSNIAILHINGLIIRVGISAPKRSESHKKSRSPVETPRIREYCPSSYYKGLLLLIRYYFLYENSVCIMITRP